VGGTQRNLSAGEVEPWLLLGVMWRDVGVVWLTMVRIVRSRKVIVHGGAWGATGGVEVEKIGPAI